jgi:hypothetical protein
MNANFIKAILVLLPFAFSLIPAFGQSPNGMSYQAVIRNSSDQLVTNQVIGMQISILQGSASGLAVYVETQTPTTNANGLVSIEIGAGTTPDDFSAIDWENGPYFIKIETDTAGGTNYTITGTSQLLSVPYALYAKEAEAISGGIPAETDPVYTAWDKSTGISITESQISDLGTYIETETDPSVPTGTQTGEMQYWNGSAWVIVAATPNEGAALQMIGGIPTWVGGTVPTPNVTNPTTGEIWMDRNLGATQVATSSTDAASYGDLYQWGRGTDGHQIRTSGTTATNATTAVPNGGNSWDGLFITEGSSPWDWLTPQDNNLWQGVSGTNNPCPTGFRLPTEAEWNAERLSWSSDNSAGAFASPLKLPVAGYRASSGSLYGVGSGGSYWSSTVDGTRSRYLDFYGSNANLSGGDRAFGLSVRCLKE